MAAGGRFYPHYYIQLLPALTLLSAPHFAHLGSAPMQPSAWLRRSSLAYVWLGLITIGFSIAHWWGLSSRRQPSAAAEYLQKHSAVDARVFVWGQSAAMTYLQSQRRPACRYVLTFPLTGYVFGGPSGGDTGRRIVPNAWNNLAQDFRNHPPAYIVDNEARPNAVYPTRNFPVLANLLAEHYRPVARTPKAIVYQIR